MFNCQFKKLMKKGDYISLMLLVFKKRIRQLDILYVTFVTTYKTEIDKRIFFYKNNVLSTNKLGDETYRVRKRGSFVSDEPFDTLHWVLKITDK